MSLKDDLIAAKALMRTKSRWWRGLDDARSAVVWFPLPHVVERHCPVTALTVATNSTEGRFRVALDALKAALPAGYQFLPQFSDDDATTHADIMALFDRAIETAS